MRKRMWSAAALIGLLVGAGIMLGVPAEVRAADGRVVMNDQLKFDPSEITVAAGTKVVWHNDGYVQHDVTADNGSFDSKGLIDRGGEYSFTFSTPGDFTYYCSPHKESGMKGVVHVTGAGGATNTTAATTATTIPAPGATTTSTAPAPAGGTTTTTRPGAAATGQSTTTTTTPTAGGVTSTTQAASTTPTSASENAGNSSGAATGGSAEQAGADHGSEEAAEKKNERSSPIGIAFASVSTLLLAAIAGKLLASKP